MLEDAYKTLARKNNHLKVDEAVKDELIRLGYDRSIAVHPLRRVIENQIRDKLTGFYIEHLDSKRLQASLLKLNGNITISEQIA